ncbi:hypothetical protein EC973_002487 [Apophysomyces ossiformis]|uniref:Fe2OG dioxygenase domain-containing protein n=1 Tax=Apophysomyces ossiformis TaxID=679940 RepID=A0A8H7ETQ5_9FUNG|nr:hypothetical protein EC973_002487 [Apophysomyces ossiformis]
MIDWEELFGEDGGEEEEEEEEEKHCPIVDFPTVPGLRLVRQALSHEQQMLTFQAILDYGHFSSQSNQSMCFGELPPHLNQLAHFIHKTYPDLLPSHLTKRQPLFDQAILNLYEKGQGIRSHVDLARFEDGILIVSFLSSCVMTMRPVNPTEGEPLGILLRPGDILALSGPARYDWEHGIEEQMHDTIDGEWIERNVRVSVTLRKLRAETSEPTMSGNGQVCSSRTCAPAQAFMTTSHSVSP